MKKIIIIVLVFSFSLLNVQANNLSIHDSITKNKQILIFTKNGLMLDGKKGYVHKNIANSVKALKEICSSQNIKSKHSEDA